MHNNQAEDQAEGGFFSATCWQDSRISLKTLEGKDNSSNASEQQIDKHERKKETKRTRKKKGNNRRRDRAGCLGVEFTVLTYKAKRGS